MAQKILRELRDFPLDSITIDSKTKSVKIDIPDNDLGVDTFSLGSSPLKEIERLKLVGGTFDCDLWQELGPKGPLGRETELHWLRIVSKEAQAAKKAKGDAAKVAAAEKKKKDAVEKAKRDAAKKDEKIRKELKILTGIDINKMVLNRRKAPPVAKIMLKDVMEPDLIETVKLSPTLRLINFVGHGFDQQQIALLFGKELTAPKDTIEAIAQCLNMWYDSIINKSNSKPPYTGYIMSESTNIFFGIAPGLPQFIVKEGDVEVQEGALAVGLTFQFNTYSTDEEGRTLPDKIETILPPYPIRDVETPMPNVITKDTSSEEIRAILHAQNDLILDDRPISLVALKKDWPNKSQEGFEELVRKSIEHLGIECLFESRRLQGVEFEKNDGTLDKIPCKWPNTYEHLLDWCLLYVNQDPLPGTPEEKKPRHFFKGFPIYLIPKAKLSGMAFTFCWFHSARGRVHDIAHLELLKDEVKRNRDKWMIIGDETGTGTELRSSDDGGDGTREGKNKKIAYIWVVIPPGAVLPTTSSDFHAMDQKQFAAEHIHILDEISQNDAGASTIVIEAPNFVSENERIARGNNNSVSPLLITSTLPLVLEYIGQQTAGDMSGKEISIQSMSEEYSWMEPGDSGFIETIVRKSIDSLAKRGIANFSRNKHKTMGKMDHPWMNYPDALGFLISDNLPPTLESYREKLDSNIIISPLYLNFLDSKFPDLINSLANSPYQFIDKLCNCDVVHVTSYMEPYLSGMISEALEKFTSVDWRQFNQLMKEKQVTNTGRIIAKKISDWVTPQMPSFLDKLETDVDRVNMCLTLAWSMDQQGGNVEYFVKMIESEWLENCTDDRRFSLAAVCLAQRQNYFDFDLNTEHLANLGLIDSEITSTQKLLQVATNSSPASELEMTIYGMIFSILAFAKYQDSESRNQLWDINQTLINYPWHHTRSARRHCIYGAEFSLDYITEDEIWFERAKKCLFTDFNTKLGQGEDQSIEVFWWPAAARFYSLAHENDSAKIPTDELENFIRRADEFTRQGNLIVRVRTSYWLLRLSHSMGIKIADDILQNIFAFLDEPSYPKEDVYGMLLIIHLIDLDQRMNLGKEEKLQDDLTRILKNSRASTVQYFEQHHTKNAYSLIDYLAFNYS